MQAPLTLQHYAVDMFLAVILSALVWHAVTRWAYKGAPVRERRPGERPDPPQTALTCVIIAILGLVGYIIIAGGA